MAEEKKKCPHEPGDKLWWQHTAKGGYGYQQKVPAVFFKELPSGQYKIMAQKADKTWVEKSVKKENVYGRSEFDA